MHEQAPFTRLSNGRIAITTQRPFHTAGYLPETRRARRRCWSLSESWWFWMHGSSPARWTEDLGRLEMWKTNSSTFLYIIFWFVGYDGIYIYNCVSFTEKYIWLEECLTKHFIVIWHKVVADCVLSTILLYSKPKIFTVKCNGSFIAACWLSKAFPSLLCNALTEY